MTSTRRAIRTTMLMAAAASGVAAQGRGGPCTLGTELSYGISALDCVQCTVRSDGAERWTEYGAEPVVRAVFRTGNPIQAGDVIVAIDGKLITSSAGGRALVRPEAGHAARFMIRRNGRTTEINVMPGTPCPPPASGASATATRNDSMTPAARDSSFERAARVSMSRDSFVRAFRESTDRLHDTLELRYERDAFGRPYHFTFANGDSVNFNIPGPGKMAFEPNGRLLFITDSVGYQRFITANGGRVPPRPFHWRWGRNLDGIPLAKGSSVIGYQIGSFGFSDVPAYTYARPDPMLAFGTTSKPLASTEDSTARLNTADMSLNTTRGWLGFALDCLRCTTDRVDPSSKIPPVHFTTPPRVVAVEPGPAAAAGFKVGDVIRTIDGKQMASAAGGTRFSNMQGGERVVFGVERGKQLITLTLVVPKPY